MGSGIGYFRLILGIFNQRPLGTTRWIEGLLPKTPALSMRGLI
jgi:hypothetical protein